MIVRTTPRPGGFRCPGRIDAGAALRVALALVTLVAAGCVARAARAEDKAPALRGDVVATSEVLTLGDLVAGVEGDRASKPLFRAPALGETGTIQVRRILEAAAGAGVPGVAAEGRAQIQVTRAARRVGRAEIEAAVKAALERQHGLDAGALGLVLDGGDAAGLLVAADATAAPQAEEVAYDRRTRRVAATVSVGKGASVRVAGSVAELVEVAVLSRALNRGEALGAGDVAVERRPRETVPADAQADAAAALAGRVARRPLAAGGVLRANDLAKPEIVARGEAVTVVYEVPGLTLTLRGRASEAGALGDPIAVVNPQSKRTLQGTVVGPGKVAVGPALPGRVVASSR